MIHESPYVVSYKIDFVGGEVTRRGLGPRVGGWRMRGGRGAMRKSPYVVSYNVEFVGGEVTRR